MATMAFRQTSVRWQLTTLAIVVVLNLGFAPWAAQARRHWNGQLSTNYYDSSCPNLEATVSKAFQNALSSDGRIGASLTRLHFHDCMVNGCDGSVLLNDSNGINREQRAQANNLSLRGFHVVADIKSSVESVCAATVSCADILALVARDAVVAAGGPYWDVSYGRLDSKSASLSDANAKLPLANDTLDNLLSKFSAVGLDQTDMVALTGAHTFGKAQCATFFPRLYNYSNTAKPDPTIDSSYLSVLQSKCPRQSDGTEPTDGKSVVDLDQGTPTTFDNSYYSNLLTNKGVLATDQAMESGGAATANLVSYYSSNQAQFFDQFSSSFVKMGNLCPTHGNKGEIRTMCSRVNQN